MQSILRLYGLLAMVVPFALTRTIVYPVSHTCRSLNSDQRVIQPCLQLFEQ